MVIKDNPKRVLQIMGSYSTFGGLESMLMNYYKNIDRSKVQFDFVTRGTPQDFHKQILDMGGRVFYLNYGPKNILLYVKALYKTIKNNGPYTAVHAQISYQAGIDLLVARLAGVKVRVCHSHQTTIESKKYMLMLPLIRKIILANATKLMACGKEAGDFLYGKNKFFILNNAIDVEEFQSVDMDNVKELYEEFCIPHDALVIGHIGRFIPLKNHIFFVEIMKELLLINPNVYLVLVGDGELRDFIKLNFEKKGILRNVRFAGMHKDIPELMNFFDVFLLPSFSEAMPVTVIEAQAVGIPILLSENITIEVDLGLKMIKYISLSNKREWVKSILNVKNEKYDYDYIRDTFINKGYDIKNNAEVLLKEYEI